MQVSRALPRFGRNHGASCAFLAFALAGLVPALSPGAGESFEASALEAHVRFLASDELKGRETGTPENERAALYLAECLKSAGLEPAGDEGTFLQAVPLEVFGVEREPKVSLVGADDASRPLEYGADFSVQGGTDVQRRLRVVIAKDGAGIPEKADPEVALYFGGTRSESERWLEERGHPDGVGFGALVMRGGSRRRDRSFEPWRRLSRASQSPAAGVPTILVNAEARDAFDRGEVAAIELELDVLGEVIVSHNVLARIDGVGTPEHPELAEQVIVFSAHFDHIGVRSAPAGAPPEPPVEPAAQDLINNGADDDASGTACVLELARAFAAGQKPARTLLFLLATGEEKGLLGTNHYLDHPVLPLERTVCNLNFEMIGRPDEMVGGTGKLWLTGSERSNLLASIEANGIPISPDLRPDQHFFERSDNFAFALRGIVAQTLSTYNLHDDYHRVTDEADTLDYPHMAACTEAAYEISRLLADGALDPVWLEGMKPEPRNR